MFLAGRRVSDFFDKFQMFSTMLLLDKWVAAHKQLGETWVYIACDTDPSFSLAGKSIKITSVEPGTKFRYYGTEYLMTNRIGEDGDSTVVDLVTGEVCEIREYKQLVYGEDGVLHE